MLSQFVEIFQGIHTLLVGDPLTSVARLVLIGLAFVLIYLGYRKTLEPLVIVPMGLGILAVNAGVLLLEAGKHGTLFVAPLSSSTDQLLFNLQVDFLQPVYNFAFSNGLIAVLVFLGIGAITDISYFMAKPVTSMVIAVFAELGTIVTLPLAIALGLAPKEAAAISLIGGADGPMVLYGSIMLAKDLFVPITIIAYLYLSLTYAVYPYLIKLLVPQRLQAIRMSTKDVRKTTPGQRFAFAIIIAGVLSLLFPVAAPLYAAFFLGVAIREMNVAHYVEFLSGPLLYGSTFFLALTLGALLEASTILDPTVVKLLGLGMLAVLLSGIGGIIGGLTIYKLSKGRFNPLVGIAGVSCIPTTAKVAQYAAFKANKTNIILPFAMGANVAGVVTTSIIAGIYISAIPRIL